MANSVKPTLCSIYYCMLALGLLLSVRRDAQYNDERNPWYMLASSYDLLGVALSCQKYRYGCTNITRNTMRHWLVSDSFTLPLSALWPSLLYYSCFLPAFSSMAFRHCHGQVITHPLCFRFREEKSADKNIRCLCLTQDWMEGLHELRCQVRWVWTGVCVHDCTWLRQHYCRYAVTRQTALLYLHYYTPDSITVSTLLHARQHYCIYTITRQTALL